ncbi:YqcI/YcgG family protein [Halorussus salilacus]|uniref:YqcI/YcgG family protein n=1 Tax=Halorussus salilacus TaxID=2953750 RepID=UPI00209EDFAC|nr:YqcI/YcgG family protein [Halorussus salilacus]USZ68255.1 YqcI/YcgG family protein [Halorussus salilacus]
MNEPGLHVLLDQQAVEARVERGDLPDWAVAHYESFHEGILQERNGTPFPCYFGVESEREGMGLYTFCDSTTDKDALFDLGETLVEYLDTYRDHSERAPLTVFFRVSEDLSEAEYHERLWHVLQFLHVHDPEPWPEDIPTDPDHDRWEFCFGGVPMFPTSRAPFYDDRKSRYCPVGLEVTFQPRDLFDGVTADTEAGQRARDIIQDRLEDYDGVCPHADLGDWGVEGDREWKQYLFSADESQAPDEPPIRVTREHPKVESELLVGA